MTYKIQDDLEELLKVIPPHIREPLEKIPNLKDLVEVVMDLGRTPEARFPDNFVILSDSEVTELDLQYVISRIGEFGKDNRAGIPRTLHRISAIRNRHGKIIGLTLRVGRAVYGTAEIIMDIIKTGKSILLLGRPGVGKTTILREVARVLNDEMKKRVIIVDTSNEIGGDGDIPHPAIGRARRMQVPTPELQHKVMIEAVENHMPEVIIIDEMGTQEEAYAARTIAERGVQLIATAHGNTLENLIMNPTLSDLIGGIQAVILSDEEARRRGTQKTVLERKNPPTFDILIEIRERDLLAIHMDVAITVDRMLRGIAPRPQLRKRYPDGKWEVIDWGDWAPGWEERLKRPVGEWTPRRTEPMLSPGGTKASKVFLELGESGIDNIGEYEDSMLSVDQRDSKRIRIYPFAISTSKLQKAAQSLNADIKVVKFASQADLILTLRSKSYELEKKISKSSLKIPIYTIRSNTTAQMIKFLRNILTHQRGEEDEVNQASKEAEEAVYAILEGEELLVELPPRPRHIRQIQHEIIRKYSLVSKSYGEEPNRRVIVFLNEEVRKSFEEDKLREDQQEENEKGSENPPSEETPQDEERGE